MIRSQPCGFRGFHVRREIVEEHDRARRRDVRALGRESEDLRVRLAQSDMVRRNRELEELDNPQLVRVAFPMQLVRVTERGEPVPDPDKIVSLKVAADVAA